MNTYKLSFVGFFNGGIDESSSMKSGLLKGMPFGYGHPRDIFGS
jgi:hypothetical protein